MDSPPSPRNTSSSSLRQYEPLYKAVRMGDLGGTREFLVEHPEAVSVKITSRGDTALHVATMFGHLHIIEWLVEVMSEYDLELANNDGLTALHLATIVENKWIIRTLECLLNRNRRLVAIPDHSGFIPVTLALDFGHIHMARLLYALTPFELLAPQHGNNGAVLLVQCYYCKMFDVALDLIRRCPALAVTEGRRGLNFLETLASMPSSVLHESQLPFWKGWLHTRPLHQLVRNTLHLSGIEKKYEETLAHKQSREIIHAAFNVIYTLNEEEIRRSRIDSAVLLAARAGNPEFIVEAINVHFPLVWSTTYDGKSLFFQAVRFRQPKVFSLIHGFVLKHAFTNLRDRDGNCLLHMAGFLAPRTQLDQIYGPLLQMQRELQWFKEVESVMPPMKKEYVNSRGLTPRELFMIEHKELVKEGEKWTKETASSCSVVAALVTTITFAAAFTVPGGYDQTKGYPILLHKKLFMLFMISNAVSLVASSTSLLIFLELLTSRYAEDDFLKSVPLKLIMGLSTMFISIATMMLAFCAALFLMLRNQLWIVIPVTMLACVPVTFYTRLQLRLLVEIYKSTYGQGIFDKRHKQAS